MWFQYELHSGQRLTTACRNKKSVEQATCKTVLRNVTCPGTAGQHAAYVPSPTARTHSRQHLQAICGGATSKPSHTHAHITHESPTNLPSANCREETQAQNPRVNLLQSHVIEYTARQQPPHTIEQHQHPYNRTATAVAAVTACICVVLSTPHSAAAAAAATPAIAKAPVQFSTPTVNR
jgi:hypothetical protein